MKKISTLIAAVAATATLALSGAVAAQPNPPATALPQTPAAAALSLPGQLADQAGETVALARIVAPSAAPIVERLHPAQLSLEGELVEDVLTPQAGLHATPPANR